MVSLLVTWRIYERLPRFESEPLWSVWGTSRGWGRVGRVGRDTGSACSRFRSSSQCPGPVGVFQLSALPGEAFE